MSTIEKQAGAAWYLIHCKAKQDERAEENLLRQGYVCFRPKHRRERLAQGKRQIICESLFPGYLFIQLSLLDNWAPLRSTRGVLRTVSFGGQPVAVDEGVIARLQEHEHAAPVQTLLTPGESVRINQGAFTELEAIFLAMDGEERVVLLMNFLQREQKINLPLSGISKLETPLLRAGL